MILRDEMSHRRVSGDINILGTQNDLSAFTWTVDVVLLIFPVHPFTTCPFLLPEKMYGT